MESAISHQRKLDCQQELKRIYENFSLYSWALIEHAEEIIDILQRYLDANKNS